MKRSTILLLTVIVSCSMAGEASTTGASDPVPPEEPDRLIAELTAAGVAADQAETFATDPVGGTGTLICIGTEEVRTYVFDDEAAATEVASKIDPVDPSNLGNAIVEWAGRPRFWRRGPMLVLYLGEDQPTEDLVTNVLGPPFAVGAGSGRGLPALPGPCTSA